MKKINKFISLGIFLSFYFAFVPRRAGAAVCTDSNGEPITSILPCMTIEEMIEYVVNFLTAGVGIAAVAAIVYAGILYTTAGGDTEKTKKAITWIRNTVIGIIAYAAMYLLLNFIIPGGVV